jgi:hypothetical protein
MPTILKKAFLWRFSHKLFDKLNFYGKLLRKTEKQPAKTKYTIAKLTY